MQIISMKQLREHFEPIREGLEKGESYLLMYRSKPLGTLLPYEQDGQTRQVLHKKSLPEPTLPSVATINEPAFNPAPIAPLANQTPSHPSQSQTPAIEPKPTASPQPLRRFGLKQMLNPK